MDDTVVLTYAENKHAVPDAVLVGFIRVTAAMLSSAEKSSDWLSTYTQVNVTDAPASSVGNRMTILTDSSAALGVV